MTTFLTDSFTDTDGTLLTAHTPDVGGAWEALDFTLATGGAQSNTSKVASSRLTGSSTTTASRAYRNTAVPGNAEYDLTWQLHIISPTNTACRSHVGARLTSVGTSSAATDRYAAGFQGAASPLWRIVKSVSGTQTVLASSSVSTAAGTYAVTFELRDAAKRLLVDGAELLTTADNAVTQNGTVAVSPAGSNFGWIDNLTAATVSAGGTFTGTATSSFPAFTQVVTASHTPPTVTATAESAFPALTQAATGSSTPPTVTGTAASSFPAFDQSATAATTAPVFTATASSAFPALTQAATGSFTIPDRTATASSTFPPFEQTVTASHVAPSVTGAASSSFPAFDQSVAASFVAATFTATVTSLFPAFTQSATASRTVPVFTATAASVFAAFTQAAVARTFGPPATLSVSDGDGPELTTADVAVSLTTASHRAQLTTA